MNTNVYYTMRDVSDARWIVSTSDKLYHNIEALLWAHRVIIWFNNYLSLIRTEVNKTCRKWNTVVSMIWKALKSRAVVIKDVP